jgi:Rv2632c-like
MEVKEWNVQIYIDEDGDDTLARAVLQTRGTGKVTGKGRARRNPVDREVPEIGDELAVSRALADLADRLNGVAAADIAQLAGPA